MRGSTSSAHRLLVSDAALEMMIQAIAVLSRRNRRFETLRHVVLHVFLATDTVISLTEQIAACEGDFEPIKRSLCRELAQRTSGMIVEHHRRVEQVRDSAFG